MRIIYDMFSIALMVATPILIAGLGGLFSERSGIVNIALEGMMLVGAFACAGLVYVLEPSFEPGSSMPIILGLCLGAVVGLLLSILHAYASINLKADQTISGTAINLLATGISLYTCQIIFNQQRTPAFTKAISKVSIPILKDIPIIGDLFFKNVYPTFYLGIAIMLITWFIVFKTPFGLRLRSCGEYPQASASMGINVTKMRYFGVLTSGLLAGLAGGVMVMSQDTQFTAATIHGYGFISIAALIFGKWNPFGVLGASIFFGFAQTLGLYVNDIPFLAVLPPEFFNALPYLLTIVALIIFSNKSVGPKAAGEIYDAGKR